MGQQDLNFKANHSVKWLCCGPQLASLVHAGQLHTLAMDCAEPWTQQLTMLPVGLAWHVHQTQPVAMALPLALCGHC